DLEQARQALTVVREVTKGRLECFVPDAGAAESQTAPESPEYIDGAIPLVSVLRLDDRVKSFAAAIRGAYIVESLDRAWTLSRAYPAYHFIARTGEVARGSVIGWGEHEEHGPLSLRREIRELDRAMDLAARETAAREADAVRLEDRVGETAILSARLRAD